VLVTVAADFAAVPDVAAVELRAAVADDEVRVDVDPKIVDEDPHPATHRRLTARTAIRRAAISVEVSRSARPRGRLYPATMRLLILGGTLFLGRHLVDAARERDHELTLFNRGRTDPEAFADVEQIRGDRERDLSLLAGRTWDAVIDTCGYVPRIVRGSADSLADALEHYTLISSISAYGTFPRVGLDEDWPAASLSDTDPDTEDVANYYGELKAACEREVEAALPGRSLVVRPGLIIGPEDPTERFAYWVARLARGGRVLVPRAPRQPVQFIDVRDLARWIVGMAERRQTGVFNATGPAQPTTFEELLQRINAATGDAAELVRVDEGRLAEAGVQPWGDMPLWLDLDRNPDFRGFLAVDVGRALATGLTLRPLEATVADTLAWVRVRSGLRENAFGPPVPPGGISRQRETELLATLDS
jgi:2'-hydroxyisoflavone reductase